MDDILVIYDGIGHIVFQGSGDVREPIGIPFLYVDVPEGKRITGVDVTVTPNAVILEDIPKTEVQLFKEHQAEVELDVDFRLSNLELNLAK